MVMSRLLVIAITFAVILYFLLLSSLAGTYLPSKGNFTLEVTVLVLALISFFVSFLSIKQSWYDVNTAYTDKELIVGRLKRIIAFFALGLNIVNIILVFTYVLIIVI